MSHGQRFPMVKRALRFVVETLGPKDSFGIVSYAKKCRLEAPLTRMTRKGKVRTTKEGLFLSLLSFFLSFSLSFF
jgi:hypothetical protein